MSTVFPHNLVRQAVSCDFSWFVLLVIPNDQENQATVVYESEEPLDISPFLGT